MPKISWVSVTSSLSGARFPCRLIGVFVLLLGQWPAWGQTPTWRAGVAKVIVRADLYREPGTAFVVALQDSTAVLVTSEHVVEGDSSPLIEFAAAPLRQYSSTVRNPQVRDTHGLHGLAVLVVNNPPTGITVLQQSSSEAKQEDNVIAAGYPAPIGELTVTDTTTVGGIRGGDLVLNRETGKGYSGGPVLRNGSVVGLVFGVEGHFGLAVPAADIRTYLHAQGLLWGSQQEAVLPEIRGALSRLSAAYATELVPEVRKEWLSMTKQQESALKRIFSDLRAVTVEYNACGATAFSPTRDGATIACTEQISYTHENQRENMPPLHVSLTLRSISGLWHVDSKVPVK
jgi:hypothetical protein